MIDKNVFKVAESGLCTGCGTCAGICPEQCIELVEDTSRGIYIPRLAQDQCNECGICLKICPGRQVDFRKLNYEIFGVEPDDNPAGSYLNSYTGHATDNNMRYYCSSGGMVTTLLLYALEEGIINGALVAKMNKENPLRPQPFIARTRDEIVSAAKSKYCPVPLNVGLNTILREDGKFAIVGLPCHIHGVRKAETVSNNLKSKILLHLGLFCNHTPSFLGIQYILYKLKVRPEEITKLEYRAEGWPSTMRITLNSGRQLLIPNYWDTGFGHFFYPGRCLMCPDKSAELADCSFGDAWLTELRAFDTLGSSMVVCRSMVGANLLKDAEELNIIKLKEITEFRVLRAQRLMEKKRVAAAIMSIKKQVNKSTPIFNAVSINVSPFSYLRAICRYVFMITGRRRRLWVLIPLYCSFRTLLARLIRQFR